MRRHLGGDGGVPRVNERGAALLISDVWLARHMDLRTLLLMDAPRSAIAARVRAHPDDTDQLCRLVGDEAMENALDRVKQSKEGEQMFQTFFQHAPACWMPEVILREVAESLARKAWMMYPDGEPAEGEGHACRGCRVNQMVRKHLTAPSTSAARRSGRRSKSSRTLTRFSRRSLRIRPRRLSASTRSPRSTRKASAAGCRA